MIMDHGEIGGLDVLEEVFPEEVKIDRLVRTIRGVIILRVSDEKSYNVVIKRLWDFSRQVYSLTFKPSPRFVPSPRTT